jgi:hypothetical protein
MSGLLDIWIRGWAAEAASGRMGFTSIHQFAYPSIQHFENFGGLTVFNRGSRRESKER